MTWGDALGDSEYCSGMEAGREESAAEIKQIKALALKYEQALREMSDQLTYATSLYIEASKARHEAEVRANKYEQALREIKRLAGSNMDDTYYQIARTALDKPGTPGENSANEVKSMRVGSEAITTGYTANLDD